MTHTNSATHIHILYRAIWFKITNSVKRIMSNYTYNQTLILTITITAIKMDTFTTIKSYTHRKEIGLFTASVTLNIQPNVKIIMKLHKQFLSLF